MSNIDHEIASVKGIADAMTDEVIDAGNGKQQYVHHVHGNPKNKLVIGTSGRGKSIAPGKSKPVVTE
jgi:hypothetical protein